MIGVDFVGPVFVRDILADGPTMYKSYILIVTCARTRAFHLELTPDLTAPAFIRSFIRFQGRRGTLSFIVSDNANTFRDQRLKSYLLSKNIKWKHNVPVLHGEAGFLKSV